MTLLLIFHSGSAASERKVSNLSKTGDILPVDSNTAGKKLRPQGVGSIGTVLLTVRIPYTCSSSVVAGQYVIFFSSLALNYYYKYHAISSTGTVRI